LEFQYIANFMHRARVVLSPTVFGIAASVLCVFG
jgi:hypothetical protein